MTPAAKRYFFTHTVTRKEVKKVVMLSRIAHPLRPKALALTDRKRQTNQLGAFLSLQDSVHRNTIVDVAILLQHLDPALNSETESGAILLAEWFSTPHPDLGFCSALELIRQGRVRVVLDMLKAKGGVQ